MSVEGKRALRKFSIDAQIDPSRICGNLELRAGFANFFNGHGSRRFLIRNNGWIFRFGHIFDSFYISPDWLSQPDFCIDGFYCQVGPRADLAPFSKGKFLDATPSHYGRGLI